MTLSFSNNRRQGRLGDPPAHRREWAQPPPSNRASKQCSITNILQMYIFYTNVLTARPRRRRRGLASRFMSRHRFLSFHIISQSSRLEAQGD